MLGFIYNGTPYYYLKNQQGDVLSIVDANNNVVGSYTYDAWGNVLSATGSMAQINPIRYRSYYYDAETNLYYLQSRYYDPEVGRFINADDTSYLGASRTVLSFNLFAYCENNPIGNSDPFGYWKIPLKSLVKVLAVVGLNPVATTLIALGVYKLKLLVIAKFTAFVAKLSAFAGAILQITLTAIAAITGIFILGPIAVGIFDAIVQRKNGIEITPKKTWFGMPYGINVGVY